jgi:hypothetical protein
MFAIHASGKYVSFQERSDAHPPPHSLNTTTTWIKMSSPERRMHSYQIPAHALYRAQPYRRKPGSEYSLSGSVSNICAVPRTWDMHAHIPIPALTDVQQNLTTFAL